ncbi:MAG: hypothetical protein AB7Q37_18315 [Pyrinomonadaceae bacterium]
MRSKKSRKKKRVPIITIELREDTTIEWDSETQSIKFLDSEGHLSEKHLVGISEGYNRDGKPPKILRQHRNPGQSQVAFPFKSEIYDRYFAVDTNYMEFEDKLLCVTGCVFVNHQIDKDGVLKKGVPIQIVVLPRLIFLAVKGTKPERYGWMKVIEGIVISQYYDPSMSFGAIVDSDLDDLMKIEKGEIDLVPGFKLPQNINLIYASTDAGKENLLNRIISAADKISSDSLSEAIESAQIYRNFHMPRDFWDIRLDTKACVFNL